MKVKAPKVKVRLADYIFASGDAERKERERAEVNDLSQTGNKNSHLFL